MLKRFKGIGQLFYRAKHKVAREVTVGDAVYWIRETETADVKQLLDVERIVYEGELPWTKSAFLSELRSPIPHLYLSMFQEEQMIGFIGCRILGNDAHITNIAVIPSLQNRGIGSYLIDEMEKFAIIKRCETISLEVRISNKDAQRLYRSLGFVSRAIKRDYYTETNEDALDMVKKLKEE